MIEAFFFGAGSAQRFATYHPPAAGSGRLLTIICPPLCSEYMRTHLVLRELAIVLSGKGQHVLRFDYRGTGDSFGELAEVGISDWLEDIALAVQEGRELSGCTSVQLLGVRAGALLVCKYAGARDDVQRLVLWDPVPDGAEYLRVLKRVQASIFERNRYLSHRERREAMHEYGGYWLSASMVEGFRSLDASTYSSVPKHKLHVVSTSPAADLPAPGVFQGVAGVAYGWETDLEGPILPQPLLERLTACLTLS
ncbi:MAG: alpha/beta hydrolase [Betaproteobacteria bacterium]|nr:alpha/beta hydrolase [Betaproteobacteria bacterium]